MVARPAARLLDLRLAAGVWRRRRLATRRRRSGVAAFLNGLPVLDIVPEVAELAAALVERVPLPPRASADATHIALAAYHGMDFLITWNAAHIANAELRQRVEEICRDNGYPPPVLCTPDELLGDTDV